jgi:GNAT superfamily N-acetyltransferase
MTIRPIRLPADLLPLVDLIVDSFQYPENPAWGIQTDEKEQLVNGIKNLRRIWPLVRLLQLLSPPTRDILRGYLWQEDGRMAGTTIIQRRGSTDAWVVGTVAVLPEFRRRGIARKLVEAGLDLIREQGGTQAILSVIDGNVPAYTLYEQLGFEHYGGTIEFDARPEAPPPVPMLPEGYIQEPMPRSAWHPRYELEERIAPESLRRYEPVEEGRFRLPFMTLLFYHLSLLAQGTREEGFAIRATRENAVVATGTYAWSKRGTGVCEIAARLDPAHGDLAPYLVNYLLNQVATLNPGLRVTCSVPGWMEALVAATERAGFERKLEYLRMGLEM